MTNTTMKKILIFSTAYLPLVGGAEIAVKELTDRLAGFSAKGGPASGWDFDLICARIKKNLPKKEKIGRITVYRVGLGCKFDKFLLPWLGVGLALKLSKIKKYDLIWAIMASFGGLAALFFKKKNSKVPYLLTLQEGDTPEHIYSRAKWLGPYYKKMFTGADFITAISQYLKNFALKQGATSPIEIVPNGVDIKHFTEDCKIEDLIALKSKLGELEKDKFIITTSRLVEKNAVDDIIKALEHLPDNIKLLILGVGPDESSLKSLVKNLKLENRVLFLGQVNQEYLPKYLKISDIFIRPSLAEGLGISFLEAMAAGVPVIATPVGGIVDFLRDGQTGLFCEVRNPKSIAQKAKIYLENKELTETIKINARELVIKNYDWDLIAEKMKSIFNSVIKSPDIRGALPLGGAFARSE
ncbi:MAG: glycosyltransferase family 4 protein [Candidatus Falkowbacteria bacterium]